MSKREVKQNDAPQITGRTNIKSKITSNSEKARKESSSNEETIEENLKKQLLLLTTKLNEALQIIMQKDQEIKTLKRNNANGFDLSKTRNKSSKHKKHSSMIQPEDSDSIGSSELDYDVDDDDDFTDDDYDEDGEYVTITRKSKVELQHTCIKLTRKVKDMEDFLSDHGIVWAGDQEDDGCSRIGDGGNKVDRDREFKEKISRNRIDTDKYDRNKINRSNMKINKFDGDRNDRKKYDRRENDRTEFEDKDDRNKLERGKNDRKKLDRGRKDEDGDDEDVSERDEDEVDEGYEDVKNGTIKMTHKTRTFIPNFEKVFSSIDELNVIASEPQIIQTKSGATFKHCELLNLTLYFDGMEVENSPFREYSTLSVQEFFRDIQDGYYPTELKGAYPNGVVFKIIDKRNVTYNEALGFKGRGQRLGEKEKNKKPSSIYVYEKKVEVIKRKKGGSSNGTKATEDDKDQNGQVKEDNQEKQSKKPTMKENKITKKVAYDKEQNGQVEDIGQEKQTMKKIMKENQNTKRQNGLMNIANQEKLTHEVAMNDKKMHEPKTKRSTFDKGENGPVEAKDEIKEDEYSKSPQISKAEAEDDFKEIFMNREPHRSSRFNEISGYGAQKIEKQSIPYEPERKTLTPELPADRQGYAADVTAISTQTSDHLLINLPATRKAASFQQPIVGDQRSGGGIQQEVQPGINITNINYREAPINIIVSPEQLSTLQEARCAFPALPRNLREKEILQTNQICKEGKIMIDGLEFKCVDCLCGCKEQQPNLQTSDIRKPLGNITEYTEKIGDNAANIEAAIKEQPKKQKGKKIDVSVKYEHFEFLGLSKGEKEEEDELVKQPSKGEKEEEEELVKQPSKGEKEEEEELIKQPSKGEKEVNRHSKGEKEVDIVKQPSKGEKEEEIINQTTHTSNTFNEINVPDSVKQNVEVNEHKSPHKRKTSIEVPTPQKVSSGDVLKNEKLYEQRKAVTEEVTHQTEERRQTIPSKPENKKTVIEVPTVQQDLVLHDTNQKETITEGRKSSVKETDDEGEESDTKIGTDDDSEELNEKQSDSEMSM